MCQSTNWDQTPRKSMSQSLLCSPMLVTAMQPKGKGATYAAVAKAVNGMIADGWSAGQAVGQVGLRSDGAIDLMDHGIASHAAGRSQIVS